MRSALITAAMLVAGLAASCGAPTSPSSTAPNSPSPGAPSSTTPSSTTAGAPAAPTTEPASVAQAMTLPPMGSMVSSTDGVAENRLVASISRVRIRGEELETRDLTDALTVKVFSDAIDPHADAAPVDFAGCEARAVIEMMDKDVPLVTVGLCAEGPVALLAGMGARRLHPDEVERVFRFAADPEANRCWLDCITSGTCTPRGAKCVATSDADCEKSTFCRATGNCTNVGDECAPRADGACAGSMNCSTFGLCSQHDGGCVPTEDVHCERSATCKGQGYCTLRNKRCLPGQDGDCANSDACKIHGLCVVGTSKHDIPACVASQAGCAAAETCRVDKRCSAQPNTAEVGIPFSESGYGTTLDAAVICR